MSAASLSTDARLRYAQRALRQAITLLREAASLGTLSERTRLALKERARLLEDVDVVALREYRVEAARHLAEVVARRRQGRRAA